MRFALAVVLASAALVGCRTMAAKPAALPASEAAAAESAQQAREAKLGLAGGDCAAPAWTMTGRVALSNGKDGGSGRIEWMQGAGRVGLTLSAPITRQSWVLSVDASGAVLDGVPNGPLRGADAAQLLRSATGWDIPVAALGCWVRGARANAAAFGQPATEFGVDQQLLRIQQGGWTIDYADWKPDAASGTALPARINAQRGDHRVRLIVDRWDAE